MINSASLSQAQVGAEAYTDLSSVHAINSLENKDEALEKIAQQFESMMMRMMMKSMRAANQVFAEGNYLSSHESDMYRDMLDDQLSLTLSQGKGMGIAEVMVRQLKGRFGDQSETKQSSMQNISDYLERRNDYQGPLPVAATDSQAVDKTRREQAPQFDGSVEKFVDTLYPMAEKAAQALGVSPEVLIAQSALETGWGRKVSGKSDGESSFNFFNIKADRRWQGESVSVSTLEIRGGVPVRERGNFRAYETVQHSFDDYVAFISNSARYEKALQSEDAESYIRGLAEAGYATDTEYAEKVIRIMNDADLKDAVQSAATSTVGEG